MSRDGEYQVINGRPAVRFERRLPHPVERVWAALTDPELRVEWYPAELTVEPRVGGVVTETFPGSDIVVPSGTVTDYDPPRLLAFDMIGAHLRWEVVPTDDGCVLVFTNIVDDKLGVVRYATGWELCIDALAAGLDRRSGDDGVDGGSDESFSERMHQLHRDYLNAFGLADAVIEPAEDGWVVRFERWLFQPVAEVWEFLLLGMAGERSEVAVGGEPPLRLTHGYQQADGVTEAKEPNLLAYDWSLEGRKGGEVRFAMTDIEPLNGGGTHLVLTQTISADLPEERFRAAAAWHTHLEVLEDWLAGVEHCWPEGRTEALIAHYRGN